MIHSIYCISKRDNHKYGKEEMMRIFLISCRTYNLKMSYFSNRGERPCSKYQR